MGYFGPVFTLYLPLTNLTIKIFKKPNKMSKYVIILHQCTKNYDMMVGCRYGFGQTNRLFWVNFSPLPSRGSKN